MSLLEFLLLSLALWVGVACLGAAAWALIASGQTPTPPPPPDPDDTADDWDEDAAALCPDCMLRREFVAIVSAEWEWSE